MSRDSDPDFAYMKLLRAWVVRELDALTPDARAWFRKGNGTTGHPEVDEAMKEYLDHRIGACSQCGKRAPLHEASGASVCAWGCTG